MATRNPVNSTSWGNGSWNPMIFLGFKNMQTVVQDFFHQQLGVASWRGFHTPEKKKILISGGVGVGWRVLVMVSCWKTPRLCRWKCLDWILWSSHSTRSGEGCCTLQVFWRFQMIFSCFFFLNGNQQTCHSRRFLLGHWLMDLLDDG